MTYNKDQWISSFEDAMVKLRPHMSARVLTTICLMAWNKYGKNDADPSKAANEWSKSMDKPRWSAAGPARWASRRSHLHGPVETRSQSRACSLVQCADQQSVLRKIGHEEIVPDVKLAQATWMPTQLPGHIELAAQVAGSVLHTCIVESDPTFHQAVERLQELADHPLAQRRIESLQMRLTDVARRNVDHFADHPREQPSAVGRGLGSVRNLRQNLDPRAARSLQNPHVVFQAQCSAVVHAHANHRLRSRRATL